MKNIRIPTIATISSAIFLATALASLISLSVLTNITSILMGILVAMNVYVIRNSKLRLDKSLLSVSILGIASSINETTNTTFSINLENNILMSYGVYNQIIKRS